MTKQRLSIVEAAGQDRLVAEWLLSVLACTEETAGEISLQRSADEQIILQLQMTPVSEQGNRSVLIFLQDVTPQQNTATERRPEERSVTGARMPRPPEWRVERGGDRVTPDLQPLSPTQVIEWVAGVAHEIRNPLSAIGNCIEILDKQLDLQGDSRELVAIALSECERLDRVLGNLLSFARCSEPLLQPVNVHELVERVLTTLQYDTRFPPAMNVVRDFRAPLQQVLWIDRDQISQVA